jgi:hypothetical protein
MNLFKRARSTTNRATGANDHQPSPSSSSTAQATGSDTPGRGLPGLAQPSFPYGQTSYASNPALSRKITYRTHEEPVSLFDSFVFGFLLCYFSVSLMATIDPC